MKHLKDGGADSSASKVSIVPAFVIAWIVIIVICAIRGAVISLISPRSFLSEFVHPIIVIALSEMAILPFYIANKLIVPTGEAPRMTLKLWQTVILVLVAIVFAIAMLFVSGMTADLIFCLMLGNNEPIIASSTFWWLSFLPVVYLPLLVLYFFIPGGIAGRLSAYFLPLRKRITMFICGILICLALTMPVYFSYYTITSDGISQHTAFTVSEYPWSEISEAVVKARHGVLTVDLHTENGKTFKLMNDAGYNNDKFDEVYPGGNEDFTADVLRQLAGQGTVITEQPDVESKLEYDYWIEYLDRIREIYK